MRLNPPPETRQAAISLRAVMEVDEEAARARKQDRHQDRRLARLAKKGIEQLAEEGILRDVFEQGTQGFEEVLPPEIRAALGARSAMTLTLDFEFEVSTRQAPRVGFYVRRGLEPAEVVARVQGGTFERGMLNQIADLGYVYDAAVITRQEQRVIEQEARRMTRALRIVGMGQMGHLKCRVYTIEGFNRFVWRKWAQKAEYDCTLVGHNLPVDAARLFDPTDIKAGTGNFTGGFSCGLRWNWQEETYKNKQGATVQSAPPRRLLLRHIGAHKDFLHLVHEFRGDRSGQFLDTIRVAQAVFGPGDYRLGSLARQLKLHRKHWKRKAPDYGGPITPEFLRYLRTDVWCTERVYRALADHYERWGLDGDLHTLFSVASIGKRLLAKFGIPRTKDRLNDLTDIERGWFISTYSGGRVESNCRLQVLRGQYRDFRSLYPLVNAIQNLQRFLLAERISSRDALGWVNDLLAGHTAATLKQWCRNKANWTQLQVIVRFRPNGKLPLPTRADYSHSGMTAAHNMGDNFLRVPQSLPEPWFTLADLIAGIIRSPFLDGDKPVLGQANMPEVMAARELVAEGRIQTRPVDLFGDPRYHIDLNEPGVDLFARLIDLRGEVQAEIKKLKRERPNWRQGWQEQVTYLDGIELSCKLVANSTAYGILLEFLVEAPKVEKSFVAVHSVTSQGNPVESIESPGEFALPEVGTFITAGARLMVALAEELCLERGMRFAYVDTDGMFVEQPGWEGDQPGPDAMSDASFRARLDEVAAELQVLNPFAENKPIWKIEDENYAPDLTTLDGVQDGGNGKPAVWEPLYGVFVSDKRGALLNLLEGPGTQDGAKTIRIRKLSGHGLGLWGGRHDYVSPTRIPVPWTRSEEVDEATGTVTIRPDPYKLKGGARWVYDLWHDFLWTHVNGRYPSGKRLEWVLGQPDYRPSPADNPAWSRPARYQQTLATWELFEQYGAVKGRLPYNFVTAAPSPVSAADVHVLDRLRGLMESHARWLKTVDPDKIPARFLADPLGGSWEIVPEEWRTEPPEVWQRWLPTDERYREVAKRAVYTTYCDTDEEFERAWKEGRVLVRGQGWRDEQGKRHGPAEDPLANQPVPSYLRPRNLASVLAKHFQHPELKRAGGKRAGWNDRLEIVATRLYYVGKESDVLAEDIAEELDQMIPGERSIGASQELGMVQADAPRPEPLPDLETLQALLARHAHNKARLARESGLSVATIKHLCTHPERGHNTPTLRKLVDAAARLDAEQATEQELQQRVATSAAREMERARTDTAGYLERMWSTGTTDIEEHEI